MRRRLHQLAVSTSAETVESGRVNTETKPVSSSGAYSSVLKSWLKS